MACFSLVITSSPFTQDAHLRAMDFIRALYQGNHQLRRVFFYQDAVLVATINQTPPQGQAALSQQWQALAQSHGFPLQACIANALRRGLSDEQEANRYQHPCPSLSAGFELAGLGEMASALSDSDRVIQF